MLMKTQVLGLGSAVLSDDSAGVKVVERLMECNPGPDVILTMGGTGGLALVDMLEDCDRLIVVDAVVSGAEPGCIHHMGVEDLESSMPFHCVSSHGPGLLEILRLREALLDAPLPKEIVILAIEAADTATLSENCTPRVEKAVASAVDQILAML
ncbi:hydrogenase maturation protease [Desulfatibacillum alkenivorans DSM 16219]|jgi:hydrogenase maturation protease|uniref:Hydrogenase maturation protease n=2 Tax=Desulfatibacillum alkenivorans TaxID=259354 RepID=A0A1M6T7J8_9BACT|nr:hydrogenase maturation protease [Desulfatibacillum alkenivorans DSM 16219]